MSWFSLVIGQNATLQLASSSANLVASAQFLVAFWPVSRNFEPWKQRTLHPILEQLNTSTKYNSDSLLSFYSLNFKKQKLNVQSCTCSRRMSSLSFSSPSTSPWTPASSFPGKKEGECDDKVKELHCKHSQLKKVQNNLFYFTDLAHFSIHLELKLNITFLSVYKIQMCDRVVL